MHRIKQSVGISQHGLITHRVIFDHPKRVAEVQIKRRSKDEGSYLLQTGRHQGRKR